MGFELCVPNVGASWLILTDNFTKLVKFFFIMQDQTLMSVTDAKNVNGFYKIEVKIFLNINP